MSPRKPRRRVSAVFWTLVVFTAVGYFAAYLTRTPVFSMAFAAVGVAPLAGRSTRYVRGILIGAGLGTLTALSACSALVQVQPHARQWMTRHGWIYVLATAGMAAAVGAIFAHLARRRQEWIEQQWQE